MTPALAHLNTSATVIGVVGILWIVAAIFHVTPGVMFGEMTQAVRRDSGTRDSATATPAGSRVPSEQGFTPKIQFASALAPAVKPCFTFGPGRRRDLVHDRQLSKHLSSQIQWSHGAILTQEVQIWG